MPFHRNTLHIFAQPIVQGMSKANHSSSMTIINIVDSAKIKNMLDLMDEMDYICRKMSKQAKQQKVGWWQTAIYEFKS
jgi:TATA-box binding protein (TBP) (component of TFIID and TFIIIB)